MCTCHAYPYTSTHLRLRPRNIRAPSRIIKVHGYAQQENTDKERKQDHEGLQVAVGCDHGDDALGGAEADDVLEADDDDEGGTRVEGVGF